MMKKMLVLALVLAVAGLANAGLTYSVNGSLVAPGNSAIAAGNVGVSVVNETLTQETPLIGGVLISGGTWVSGEVVAANLPGTWSLMAGIDAGAEYKDYFFIIYDVPAVAPTKAGNLFNFVVDFGADGGTFQMVDQSLAALAAPVTIIPEPMTMGLLALGALFLRKK